MKKLLYVSAAILSAYMTATLGVSPANAQDQLCVDGSTRDNFISTWQADDTVSVQTKSGKPVCEDVVMYFSSYTLPASYNGERFGDNPTAYPQQLYHATKFTITKNQTASGVVTVAMPDLCKTAAQVDVYLGPEITVVGADGHQGRGVRGTNGNNHIVAKKTCVTPTVTTDEPVAVTTELPKTGSGSVLGIGLVASVATAGASYLRRR